MVHDGHGHSGPGRQNLRHHLIAALGEFVGAFLFLFFGYANHSIIATAKRPTPEGLRLGLAGQLPWIRIAVLFPTQLVASICAGGIVETILPGPISRVNTKLAPDVSVVQGVFLEMFFTAYLLFVVFMVAAEKSKDTFIAPVAIGLAAFIALIPALGVPSLCYDQTSWASTEEARWDYTPPNDNRPGMVPTGKNRII
ncbi:hypothetical protein MCOR27_005992 [Pyricularia oryzae]|uniref:Aquaporin-like protein n=1 Tax=Pyricularia grisea TaxID=148305 RepID=A0ABQ8N9P6_PYRGI|nr:hypothetical protein MCOR01_000563 [Pyricularia oryzae]KAI6293556.1 hypothetical protein MCOR33_009064 [Pyricularia grisea]KAI6256821.1 hypothetical protein MCOR19_006733 [Pyricularia oryzae]KAI6266895.1 hypothetical protein MCOR26_009962 [Pyricularia oryzae]KAI6277459.1 hypothetical protein MCOR27_005992 [Pyricularia oryzae]